jgi:predicted MFS family arabinose efflux permease
MAFAADITRPERRAMIMAILGMGIGGAFLLSMVLSVPIANLLGLNGLFWLTAAFAVAGMALVMTLPASTRAPAKPAAEGASRPIAPVWLLAVSVFLLHSAMTLMFVALPPLLVNGMKFALVDHWKLYVPAMLGSVAVLFPILRQVGKQLAEQSMIPWAFLLLAVATALLSLKFSLLAMAVLLAVFFLGFNLLEAGMPALLSRLTGSRGRGRRMGLYSTFQFLGAFVGGVAGGWLLGALGSGAALLSTAVLCGFWGFALKGPLARFFLTGQPD